MSGADEERIWNRMAYAEGLQYHLLYMRQLVLDAERHDILCASLSGGKVRRIEIVKLNSESQEEILV